MAELLIAAGLCAVLSCAMLQLQLQQSVLVARQRHFRLQQFSIAAAYSADCIAQSVRGASVLVEPAVSGSRLLGYENVNPDDLSRPLVPSEPQTYFLYCFNSGTGALYKYSGAYPPALSLDPFYCGKPAGGAQTRESVVPEFSNSAVTYGFFRNARNANTVEADYSFSYGTDAVSGHKTFSLQKSL